MKKQKFCYGRFLSIILSLALLCSALVFPVSVNAETDPEVAKDAAATALKTAWQKLENERKGTAFAYPNRNMAGGGWAGENHLQPTAEADKDYYGDYYSYVDSTDSAFAGKETRVWYGAAEKGKDIPNNGIYYTTLRQKSGFYIYVKVEGTTEGASIKINPEYNWMKTTTNDKTVTITRDGVYLIKDTDLYKNGLEDLASTLEATAGDDKTYDRRIQRFILKFTNLNGAKVTCGSLHWADSDTTLPEDIETISALALIAAASNVAANSDKYISQNWVAFQTALANANAAYADELTASELKKAFINMMPSGKSTAYTAENINLMTNDQLLVAATSLHTERVISYEGKRDKFNAALEAFKAANYTPEAAARINLKEAYRVLPASVAQYSSHSQSWWVQPNKETFGEVKATTAESPERTKLGTYYVQLIDGEIANGKYMVMQTQNKSKPELNTFDGFYFYIQVTDTLKQDFKFSCNTQYAPHDSGNENTCVLTAGTEPGYYLFTDRDFYSKGYSGVKATANNNSVFFRVKDESNSSYSYTGGNINIGAVFGYKYVATLPDGSNDWSLAKFANHTVDYIDTNKCIISEGFRKLFADAQALGAGVYNGNFYNGDDGFTLITEEQPEYKDGKLVGYFKSYVKDQKLIVENQGWKSGSMLKNKVVIERDTDYVLTYRFKASAKTNYIRSGINLVGNNKALDSNKISITVSSNAVLEGGGWAPKNWINGIRHTETGKLVNVAVRFNSGDNDYLNMSMSYQDPCVYTYDYFKLTKVSEIKSGNVNGDSKVDILDLVVLKKFLNDGDTDIAFEAAKLNSTGTTVDNDDFNALRKYLLTGTFQ